MIYKINLSQPIFFVWGGFFSNAKGMVYQHRETLHSENFEIFIAIKNDLILNINNRSVIIKENEIFIAPPNAIIKSEIDINYELSFYWFHFIGAYELVDEHDVLIENGVADVAALKKNTSLNNFVLLPDKCFMIPLEPIVIQSNLLINNVKMYHYTQRSNDFFMSLLLVFISDGYMKSLALRDDDKIKKTAVIAEWIRVNISFDVSLVSIAHYFGLNASYLSRIFKCEQGISLKGYILHVKLEHAKRLLLTTNLSISEITERSFFSDAKHFMRLFKQKNKVTPTQFRLNHSDVNLNSAVVCPPEPIPEQLGNKALRRLISEIMEENGTNQQQKK